jgi:hypothetical protein
MEFEMNKDYQQLLLSIAQKYIDRDIPTLETRNSDDLDFYDVSICGIKEALHEAFMKGVELAVGKQVNEKLRKMGVNTDG